MNRDKKDKDNRLMKPYWGYFNKRAIKYKKTLVENTFFLNFYIYQSTNNFSNFNIISYRV